EQIEALTNSSTDWDKHFVLAAHVDLLSVTGRIGSSTTAFTGSLDGAGYLLFDYSDSNSGSETGLFGVVNGNGETGGILTRVNLTHFDVSGVGNVGALVGTVSGGLVERVQARGLEVSGTGDNVGGLLGVNSGELRDSLVDSDVSLAG